MRSGGELKYLFRSVKDFWHCSIRSNFLFFTKALKNSKHLSAPTKQSLNDVAFFCELRNFLYGSRRLYIRAGNRARSGCSEAQPISGRRSMGILRR